jgi:hypothetical protein
VICQIKAKADTDLDPLTDRIEATVDFVLTHPKLSALSRHEATKHLNGPRE